MKLKTPLVRKFGWMAASAGAIAAPVAIVIACGTTTTPTATEVPISAANLAKVRVTGDTHNIKFEVPRELTHVSGGALSATGEEQAFDVYGRTGLPLGSGEVNNSALNNFNFMPLPLLEAYMAQRLSYVNNRLVIINGDTRLDVLATYGSVFGFTEKNVIPPRLFGPWSKTEFFLKYVARPGYVAPGEALNTEVPINTAPTDGTLATYVNLDLAYLSPAEQSEFAQAFGFEATSTQASVTWTNATPKLPAALETYVVSATYAADGGAASATLPTSFAYEPTRRTLFANLTARPGFVLSTPRLDITAIARVKAIPTLLDASPEYPAIDLSKVTLTIANNKITLDQAGVTLPRGAKLQFRLGDGPWVDSVASLIETLPTTTSANFDNMRVRLAGTDEDGAVYVVGTDKETTLNATQGVAIIKTTAFFDLAAQMKIDAPNSTPSALQWTGVPAVPASLTSAVLRPEYLLGEFASEAQASASPDWSATVPTQLPNGSSSQTRLWTRLVPNPNYFLVPELADLTISSELAEFIAAQTFVDISELVRQAQGLLITTDSTHDQLIWNDPQGVTIPNALTTAVARVEYLSGDYPTAAATTTAPASAWQATLPKLLDAIHEKRFLWVRFVPVNDTRLSTSLVEITTSSRVQEIATRIDALPAYADFTSGAVKISVTSTNELTATTPPLPVGAELQYRYGEKGEWGPLTTIASALINNPTYNASEIMVRLFNTNTSKYVLVNDKMGAPDLTGLVGVLDLTSFFTALDALKIDTATSEAAALVWQNVPTLSESEAAGVDKLEWIIGAYATAAEIPATATWSATLPTSFTPPMAPRNLWVRVTAKAGYFVKSDLVKGLFAATTLLDQVSAGTDTSSFVTPASALRAVSTSTHDALTFTNAPTIPADLTEAVTGIEYLTGDYPTVESASAATGWSTALPSSTVFEAAKRYLYARLVPRTGFALTQSVFDLTTSSEIRVVRAKVDTQANYATIDLHQITLTGSLLAATINAAAVTLPTGAVVRYQITPASLGASGWLTAAALTTYLNTNLEQITASDIATLRAHFESSDATRYVIVDDRAANVDVANFSRLIDVDLGDSYNATLTNGLVVAGSSRHNAVVWNNAVPIAPATVSKVEFLTGNFSDAASANAASTWSTTLPTSVEYTHASRYFWVRLTPTRGYNLTSPALLDLTTSSKVQGILTLVDGAPGYASLDLSQIKISGSLVNSTLDASAITVPTGALLRYQITGRSEPLSAADFTTYLRDNVSTITEADVANMQALFVTSDATKFVISDARRAFLDRTNFSYGENVDIAPLTTSLKALATTAAARHNNLTWNGTTPTLPTGVTSVEYLSGNYPTPAAVASASASAWSTTLPTTASYTHGERYLWVRINLASGYTTTMARVIDLTSTSTIQSVLSVVDSTPGYAALDLGKIKITGGVVASRFDISAVTVPTGAALRYQITTSAKGQSGWISMGTMMAYLSANFDSIVADDLKTIEAQFIASETTRYVVVNPLTKLIDSTQLSLLIDLDLTTTLNRDLAALAAVLATSRHNNVVWNNSVPTLPANVAALDFVTGKYATATEAQAAATWASTLPTTVNFEPTDRYFWARITAARGYRIISGVLLNLTTSSQVQSVIATIDATPAYVALDLTKVKITGALYDAKLDVSAVSLPDHTHLEYQINTTSGGYSAWMVAADFITYLKTNYDNISEANLREMRAQLVNDGAPQYELLDPKAATINSLEFKRDIVVDMAALLLRFTNMRPANGATNENATWTNAVTSATPVTIEYVADATPEQLATPPELSNLVWTSTPPTTFTNNKQTMSLWTRLTIAKGYVLPDTAPGTTTSSYTVFNENKTAYLDVTDFTQARTMTSIIDANLLDQYYNNFANPAKIVVARRIASTNTTFARWEPPTSVAVPEFLRNVAGRVRYLQVNAPGSAAVFETNNPAGVHDYVVRQNWGGPNIWVTPPNEREINGNQARRFAWIILDLLDNYVIRGRETERYFYVSKNDQVQALP